MGASEPPEVTRSSRKEDSDLGAWLGAATPHTPLGQVLLAPTPHRTIGAAIGGCRPKHLHASPHRVPGFKVKT